MDSSLPDPSVHGTFQTEFWSSLPFPSPEDFPDARTESTSPALADRFFTTEPPGNYYSAETTIVQKEKKYSSKE